jgi:X-Pro dipeptidyl-peptidase
VSPRRILSALCTVAAFGVLGPFSATAVSIRRSRPLRQGKPYNFRWDLQPDDYVFGAGHRIGLVVVSTDHDYTIRPAPGTRLSLYPAHSRISLPAVGGSAALGF